MKSILMLSVCCLAIGRTLAGPEKLSLPVEFSTMKEVTLMTNIAHAFQLLDIVLLYTFETLVKKCIIYIVLINLDNLRIENLIIFGPISDPIGSKKFSEKYIKLKIF